MYTPNLNLDRLHAHFCKHPFSLERETGKTTAAMHEIAGLVGVLQDEPDRNWINVVLQYDNQIRDFANELTILLMLHYGYDDMYYDQNDNFKTWFGGSNKVRIRFMSESMFRHRRYSSGDNYVFDLFEPNKDREEYFKFFPRLVLPESGTLQDKGVQNTITISELYKL
jgi:hypothetical protein